MNETPHSKPLTIERAWVVEIRPYERVVVGTYPAPGADAEAGANECLRQIASDLGPGASCHVMVHVWLSDGRDLTRPHEVRFMDTDDSVRGKLVHYLDRMLSDPAARLRRNATVERVLELRDALGGVPNVIHLCDKLRELALREVRSHELHLAWEDGAGEYYACLAAQLQMAYPALEAVERARLAAVREVAPESAEATLERAQLLKGVEAAWRQSLSLVEALEVAA